MHQFANAIEWSLIIRPEGNRNLHKRAKGDARLEVNGKLSCTVTMTKLVAGWCYCTEAHPNEMSLSSLRSRLSGMVQGQREFRVWVKSEKSCPSVRSIM